MNATDELVQLDPALKVEPYLGGEYHSFRQTDCAFVSFPSGIDVEEGEFLYGLVRICKPEFVLETGTNMGISARYIALALKRNGRGRLRTIEHDTTVHRAASNKIAQSGFSDIVECVCGKVEDQTLPDRIDFAWLDTEPLIRYGELVRIFPHMAVRGIIAVHDLVWPDETNVFGSVPEVMRELLDTGQLTVVTFKTYRNVTLFQRTR